MPVRPLKEWEAAADPLTGRVRRCGECRTGRMTRQMLVSPRAVEPGREYPVWHCAACGNVLVGQRTRTLQVARHVGVGAGIVFVLAELTWPFAASALESHRRVVFAMLWSGTSFATGLLTLGVTVRLVREAWWDLQAERRSPLIRAE